MSGPALRNLSSHHAIHETGYQEAWEAFELAQKLDKSPPYEGLTSVVEVFLEIVSARILNHAAEEEQGLYEEWNHKGAIKPAEIAQLTREHDSLRELARALELRIKEGRYDEVLPQMSRLLETSSIHSRHEESVLMDLEQEERTES